MMLVMLMLMLRCLARRSRLRRRGILSAGLGHGGFPGFAFRRGKISGLLGMRFTETARVFTFRVLRGLGGFAGRGLHFRGIIGHVCLRRDHFFCRRTRAAGAATAAATATATIGGASRRRG
jgi:hypothetical protein